MLNLLYKKKKLKIPLSELFYHTPDIGISFYWNQLQILIPYHRLPIKASLGSLLEEFKTSFQGKGAITIFLECNRLTFFIEITEVKINKNVIRLFKDFISRIEGIVKQIKSLVEQQSLNLEKTQIVLYQNGFQFDDDKVHRILVKIINLLPPRKTVEKLAFPLSHLNYHSNGIRFFNKDTQFEVEKKKLPVEVGPAMERIKSNFTGDITFHIETTYLHRWDTDRELLQIGQISREVKDIEVNPNIPEGFKSMRNQLIIDSINGLIENVSISMDSVKSLLEDWGLNLKNQEIAYQLISTIAPWPEEKNIKVALRDITYQNEGIVVPIEGQNIRISAKNLSFDTDQLLENIKQTFEGYIKIHVYQSLQFQWDEEKEQLAIEKKKSVKVKISMDDETIKKIKKIYWLYIDKGIEIGPDSMIPDQYEYPGDEPPGDIPEADRKADKKEAAVEEEITGDVEKPGFEEKKEEKEVLPGSEEYSLDLPRPIDQVPDSELETKGYDAACIRLLEKMADTIYMTSHDLWFRIGNRLIWERPEKDTRTYIFEWPEEDLEFFVGKIWASELIEIREEKEETGYITRVKHTPGEISRWKRNLNRALKKKIKN